MYNWLFVNEFWSTHAMVLVAHTARVKVGTALGVGPHLPCLAAGFPVICHHEHQVNWPLSFLVLSCLSVTPCQRSSGIIGLYSMYALK